MKKLCTSLTLLIFSLSTLSAQFETSFTLYDTIAQGPYIEQEKTGYNFLFKTKEEGTMVSTRGQVVNPSMDYHIFNHYHLSSDGTLDSLFSVPIRSEVDHHYTMYKRGAPKIIQYRVGTSNDPSIEKIKSKYPILSSERNNDEAHTISEVNFENGSYTYHTKSYNKGALKESTLKAVVELDAEEGKWVLKHQYSAPNIDLPLTLQVYGKAIEGDKTRKYNDLMEFRFIALNQAGEIVRDEEMFFDIPYEFHNSGSVHHIDGTLEGFYMSMIESGGRANKEFNPAAQKVLFFDKKGYYENEADIMLPFVPKGNQVNDQKVCKVLSTKAGKKVFVYTSGNKKEKIAEGVFTFQVGEELTELLNYKPVAKLHVEQDQRNNFEGGPPASTDYKYGVGLKNGHFLTIASDNGTSLEFLQYNEKGEIIKKSSGFLLNDIASQKNILSFEYLSNNKLLIVSKVGYEKAVYTSYGIYDVRSGKMTTIQPEKDIATIHSVRNGNDIMVFGTSFEDDKLFHLILYKLETASDGLTSLGQ